MYNSVSFDDFENIDISKTTNSGIEDNIYDYAGERKSEVGNFAEYILSYPKSRNETTKKLIRYCCFLHSGI